MMEKVKEVLKLATKEMITTEKYDKITRSNLISNLHYAGCDEEFIVALIHCIDMAHAMG